MYRYVRTYVRMYACMHACMHVCMYVYVFIYLIIYIFIYLSIYISLYLSIDLLSLFLYVQTAISLDMLYIYPTQIILKISLTYLKYISRSQINMLYQIIPILRFFTPRVSWAPNSGSCPRLGHKGRGLSPVRRALGTRGLRSSSVSRSGSAPSCEAHLRTGGSDLRCDMADIWLIW